MSVQTEIHGQVVGMPKPSGVIAFVSDAFAWRTSDVEIVKQCGIVDELEAECFRDQELQIMAGRVFNSIVPLLLKKAMR